MPLAIVNHLDRRGSGPEGDPNPIEETDLDRILKLVPTEVLSLYVCAIPIASDVPTRFFPIALFAMGLVAVPVMLALDGRATRRRARWPQYLVRTVAFAVWACAASWPFETWIAPGDGRWVLALAVLVVPYAGGEWMRDDNKRSRRKP